MTGPDLALAASARDWPDRLHRFLLDHGGGRVRSRVMGSAQALSDEFELLVIDDICSFLTPRLVRSLRERGREIVGVYDPADAADAKRHLLECGITDVIESDASPDEFLEVAVATLSHRRPVAVSRPGPTKSFRIGVVGAVGGVGVTEVAIGLARALAGSVPTVLVDLDQQTPSVAQRLDLPLHPNLLSAVDAAHHGGDMGDVIIERDGLGIIGGLAVPGSHEVSATEIEGVLDEIAASGFEMLVADLGAAPPERLGPLRLNALILVGTANPVGISRLVRLARATTERGHREMAAVVNRTEARRKRDIRSELARLIPELPVVALPEDRGLEAASWDGVAPGKGPFARAVSRIAALIEVEAR